MRIGSRRIRRYQGASAPLYLPAAGPYSGLTPVLASAASNQTVSSNINAPASSRTAPIQRNALTINANRTINRANTGNYCIFYQVNVLTMNTNAGILASGDGGGDPFDATGGDGGRGGSGGGGGGGRDATNSEAGGNGGSGANGTAGVDGSDGNGGGGGPGTGSTYNSGYTYGTGGNGGAPSDSGSVGGAGGNGFGGGGGGTYGYPVVDLDAGGGGAGAGGGGLIVIAANSIVASAGSGLAVAGGVGTSNVGGSFIGGGGGGGILYVMAKAYNGGIAVRNVSGMGGGTNGQAFIFKIESDNSLTAKLFTDTW